MGLFSTKKKVYVSSVVYNMAGAEEERADYLKTTVTNGVLFPQIVKDESMGAHIVDSLFNGPHMQQRQFQRWSANNFPIGTPTANIVRSQSTGAIDFTPHIPVPPGSTAEVLSATAEAADFFYWAEQYILEFNPSAWADAWTSDYDSGANQITIEYPLGPDDVFTPAGYDRTAYYIYVRYTLVTPQVFPAPDLREPRIWIYKVGDGITELDNSVDTNFVAPEFYPFIPVRINNVPIDDPYYTTTEPIYEDCKKAYRRATGFTNRIDGLLASIEDNPQIDDIDYCYMVYGVPMNTKENAGKLYLYEFFKQLIPYQAWGRLDLENWISEGVTAAEPAANTIRIHSAEAVTASYDMRIHWVTMDETVHFGQGKPEALPGECWVEIGTATEFVSEVIEGTYEPSELDHITFFHQIDKDRYRKLQIWGLVHENYVYDGKAVRLTASEALAEVDESGFIIPMHVPTIRELSLVNATRVASSNVLLVFNCYEVVKTRWYQRGIFKIIVAIAMIIITVVLTLYFGPAGLAASTGLLGTNLAVGTALGFTGLTAAIVGAVVNALAAMLLTIAITQGATALFGEKFGAIIGAIASIIAMNAIIGFQMTGSLAINWGDMMSAQNLLKLTEAVNTGIQGYVRGEIGEMQEELKGIIKNFESEMGDIEKRTAELLGYSGALINPLMFTEAQDTSMARIESRSSFLDRTLLTGTDIAEISMGMIKEFPRLTLELPKYTT